MKKTVLNVLKEIELLAEQFDLPIIGSEKARALSNLLKEKQIKNALEVGTLIGYSGIVIASSLPEDGKLVTIEINEKNASIAEKYFEKSGLKNKIDLIIGDARDVIPRLKTTFDFMFIDADKRQYFQYLKLAEPLLRKGCLIVADNVKMFADILNDYLHYVRNSRKYKSYTIAVGYDAMEVSEKMF